jgi:dethiobiotin synthetase
VVSSLFRSINHTLLTIEALQIKINVAGIFSGEENKATESIILSKQELNVSVELNKNLILIKMY